MVQQVQTRLRAESTTTGLDPIDLYRVCLIARSPTVL